MTEIFCIASRVSLFSLVDQEIDIVLYISLLYSSAFCFVMSR